MTSTSTLLRNTIFNLLSFGGLLAVGIISTPILFHRLGTEAYGVLSITLIVTGYFGVLDLGVGPATVKFLSERLAAGARDDAARLLSTALVTQGLLGVVGMAILWGVTPLLVGHVLRVPTVLRDQARLALMIVGVGVPFVLVGGVLEGVLMTLQRFDITGPVRVIAGALKAGLAIALVIAGFGIVGAVGATVFAQLSQTLVMAAFVNRLAPSLAVKFRWAPSECSKLLSFGGWVTISTIVSPILAYLDRFLLGTLVSMRAVTYYSVPYDAVTKLWIIPNALNPVLFPAFAALRLGEHDRGRLLNLHHSSIKYVFVIIGPLATIIAVFAPQILRFWMGQEISLYSSQVMQILTLGVLLNSLAQTPYVMVQASGRPDLTAKLHLIETPFHVLLCLWLIPAWGVIAAAAIWSLRALADMITLFAVAARIAKVSVGAMVRPALGARSLLLVAGFGLSAGIIWRVAWGVGESVLSLLFVLLLYVVAVWHCSVPPTERQVMLELLGRIPMRKATNPIT